MDNLQRLATDRRYSLAVGQLVAFPRDSQVGTQVVALPRNYRADSPAIDPPEPRPESLVVTQLALPLNRVDSLVDNLQRLATARRHSLAVIQPVAVVAFPRNYRLENLVVSLL